MHSINSLWAKGHDYHNPQHIQADMIMYVHSTIPHNQRSTVGEDQFTCMCRGESCQQLGQDHHHNNIILPKGWPDNNAVVLCEVMSDELGGFILICRGIQHTQHYTFGLNCFLMHCSPKIIHLCNWFHFLISQLVTMFRLQKETVTFAQLFKLMLPVI